jgi:hypothetical protein
MVRTLEIPFPPSPQSPVGSRLEPPFVSVEPRWEYREVVCEGAGLLDEGELNRMGEEGWELVGIATVGTQVHFYFKHERHR